MACEDLSAALPAPAHPMAKPGYGKRSVPDQPPSRPGDFGHLPARAAYIAGFLDRLCENAAMDAKTIAKAQPLYGQQAVRSALNELGEAGHLRRVRHRVEPTDTGTDTDTGTGTRWVFRTYWSRTARDNEWWARFLDGDVPGAASPETPITTSPVTTSSPASMSQAAPSDVTQEPQPSAAYVALAQLGRAEPRLALSHADCAALEGLAAEWFARGADTARFTQVLVAGLPEAVYSPRALVQRRLRDKMPPDLAAAEGAAAPRQPPPPRLIMECTECRVPGRPEALPGGLCRACRGGTTAEVPRALPPTAVQVRAAQVRGAIRTALPLRV
ncbi:hypothetical protein [Streptomyces sp. NBC_00878]|uniref:hypothetical protein n=1 Tax=Streptomyces sp. NBC_00878 TaxID=2975854 RepID=UPI00225A6C12|nr:hypothetical protein [Streptomyces sp. NBC_00878]MCX4906032.1 hypothetical protein [Streptomyces sp. NBC_00878]